MGQNSDNSDPKEQRTTEHLDTFSNSELQTQDRSHAPGKDTLPNLQAGQQFGNFLLVTLLGEGGFGQVWESVDQRTGRRVALKLLTAVRNAPQELIERFKQEGRLAASINHNNCVYIFGAEEV